jgi:hypothetical protein
MILSSHLNEEIERIRFISNYDPTKLVTEQKSPTPAAKPQAKLTPQQIQAAKQKIQQQATKSANSIFQELMKAFDMDGDRVLTDYDGTNEGLAIAAIKKIKNRETLEALNKRIGATKQYKDLKSWLNAEMSDFDSEYGQIWSKLEKMGYAGANYNMLLKVAGYTGVGMMIKGADKAIDTLRGMTLDQIMEGFRDFLNGLGGLAVQSLLAIFGGPLGAGINMFAWAALTIYDIYKSSKGNINWLNIIIDVFSLITNGIAARSMSGAKLASAEVQTAEGTISALAKKFPKIYEYVKSIGQNLTSFGGKIVGMIENALGWLSSKLPFLKTGISGLKSAITKVATFLEKISVAIKAPVGSKTVGNLAKKGLSKSGVIQFIESKVGQEGLKKFETDVVKRVTDYTTKHADDYANEVIKSQVCSKMGQAACDVYEFIEMGVHGTKAVATTTAGASSIAKNTPVTDVEGDVAGLTTGIRNLKKGAEKISKIG